MTPIVIDKIFSRRSGPRVMDGRVVIQFEFESKYRFTSEAEWPVELERTRFEPSVRMGVEEALHEFFGDKPLECDVRLLAIYVVGNLNHLVPVSYYGAAYEATRDALEQWKPPGHH